MPEYITIEILEDSNFLLYTSPITIVEPTAVEIYAVEKGKFASEVLIGFYNVRIEDTIEYYPTSQLIETAMLLVDVWYYGLSDVDQEHQLYTIITPYANLTLPFATWDFQWRSLNEGAGMAHFFFSSIQPVACGIVAQKNLPLLAFKRM